ncbi:MAG: hypothetical protein LBN06_06110 [Prevotellaceae bacterium]|jgi:hypothetical protein|nr:hypothetical protein [Prevotellaceae bacterium]
MRFLLFLLIGFLPLFSNATNVAPDTIRTYYQGVLLQAAPDHSLLFFDGDRLIGGTQLPIKGNLTALSANSETCCGVTDAGEIVRTNDGINWTVFDFNTHYDGYYPACRFTCVCVTEDLQVAVAGVTATGAPAMFISVQGNVWNERPLVYTDPQGNLASLTELPEFLYYNIDRSTFLLMCTHNKLMILPPCSHCNEVREETPVTP